MALGHHVYQDGVTSMQAFNSMTDSANSTEYPFMKRKSPGFLGWVLIWLTIPMSWVQGFTNYYSRPKDVNCIKKHGLYTSGDMRAKNASIISIKKIKELSKAKKATIGDIVMAMASNVIHEHFKERGDLNDEITFAIPFSFVVIPEKIRDYVYGNNFIALTMYLKLKEKLDDAIEVSKRIMTEQIKQIPGGWYALVQSYMFLYSPATIFYISRSTGTKHSMLFSNVPGFIKPVKYFGGTVKRHYFIGSGAGNITSGIYALSCHKRLTLNVCSATSEIEDVPAFVEKFNKRIA